MQAPQATQAQSRVRGGAFASAFVGRRGRYRHRPVPAPDRSVPVPVPVGTTRPP